MLDLILGVMFFMVLHHQKYDQPHEDLFFSSTFYPGNISSIFPSSSSMHCPIPTLHVPQFQRALNPPFFQLFLLNLIHLKGPLDLFLLRSSVTSCPLTRLQQILGPSPTAYLGNKTIKGCFKPVGWCNFFRPVPALHPG